MVSSDKYDFPVEPTEVFGDRTLISHCEISHMIDRILGLNASVPSIRHFNVHVVNVAEWAIAVFDNIGVPKMGVGSEEVHVLTINEKAG